MATRTSPGVENVEAAPKDKFEEATFRQTSFFAPIYREIINVDPVARAIKGSWRNRQQHGRVAYEQMLRHGASAAPFRALLNVLKSIQIDFIAPQEEPTKTQRDMAAFLNAQLKRVSWTKLVDGWFGNGYAFGFNLAELTTVVEPWNGRPFVQVRELVPLPQQSLDDAYHMAFGDVNSLTTNFIPEYTCFDFDERGRITGYFQYRLMKQDKDAISWTTPHEKLRILHFKHGGGDGNPFGESIFYPAFEHWADLYLLEKIEQVFLENAFPYLTASYAGDEPKPALHTLVAAYVSEQDPSKRLLIGNNIDFGKVTATDPDFIKHVESKKRELRDYITFVMMMPKSVYREGGADDDLDTRNLVQMFLKFTLPAFLDEIGEVMTHQFGKRLIDANYSNVEAGDYPRFRWRFITPNDLRLVQSLLQMVLPHIHSEKLGEVFAEYLPNFSKEYIAQDSKDSVGVVRQAAITAAGAEATAKADPNGAPPPKEAGETRERLDGQTESVGQEVGTDA